MFIRNMKIITGTVILDGLVAAFGTVTMGLLSKVHTFLNTTPNETQPAKVHLQRCIIHVHYKRLIRSVTRNKDRTLTTSQPTTVGAASATAVLKRKATSLVPL